jgi:hypothetical protein
VQPFILVLAGVNGGPIHSGLFDPQLLYFYPVSRRFGTAPVAAPFLTPQPELGLQMLMATSKLGRYA